MLRARNVWQLVGWMCAGAVLLLMALVALWWICGGRVLAVASGSMEPMFGRGDSLLVWPVRPADVRVGDVVVFRSQLDGRRLVSHRVVAIDSRSGRVRTQGDALEAPDNWMDRSMLHGRAVAVAPGLGLAMDWVRQPLGLVLVVYIPALCVVAREVLRMQRRQESWFFYRDRLRHRV